MTARDVLGRRITPRKPGFTRRREHGRISKPHYSLWFNRFKLKQGQHLNMWQKLRAEYFHQQLQMKNFQDGIYDNDNGADIFRKNRYDGLCSICGRPIDYLSFGDHDHWRYNGHRWYPVGCDRIV